MSGHPFRYRHNHTHRVATNQSVQHGCRGFTARKSVVTRFYASAATRPLTLNDQPQRAANDARLSQPPRHGGERFAPMYGNDSRLREAWDRTQNREPDHPADNPDQREDRDDNDSWLHPGWLRSQLSRMTQAATASSCESRFLRPGDSRIRARASILLS